MNTRRKPLPDRYPPELLGSKYGNLTVASLEIRREKNERRVYCTCDLTQTSGWVSYKAMMCGNTRSLTHQGRIKGCPIEKTLASRYGNMKQRCNNPKDADFKNYGGRGIKNEFTSPRHFMEYVKKNLPHPDYVDMEIDRIDNDGNYTPGNLKLSTKSENNHHRQDSRMLMFKGELIYLKDFKSPYTEKTTQTYFLEGLTGEEIIERARLTVLEKRNNHWKSIEKRLALIDPI